MNEAASSTGPIRPDRVRYIKLGAGGSWEKECIEKGIVRFGFGTDGADRFALCLARDWDGLTKSFLAENAQGTATRFTNETRWFFEDQGSTLWITFVGERLYWGFLDPSAPEKHPDSDGVFRRVAGGWQSTDVKGNPLTKDRLSGALTKVAAYRGTSCSVDPDYVVRRINGQTRPQVEQAVAVREAAHAAIRELMRLLHPQDFEILVDLVFSTSGWRRQGVVGKTQKTLDLDLVLPSTGERAFVQVKSQTTSAQLAEYVARLDELSDHDWMFYVFHSGEAVTTDDRVKVLGPDELAPLVLDAGLLNWLINKVS